MLILRKLLNLPVTTMPKKATIPDRLYKHCTKIFTSCKLLRSCACSTLALPKPTRKGLRPVGYPLVAPPPRKRSGTEGLYIFVFPILCVWQKLTPAIAVACDGSMTQSRLLVPPCTSESSSTKQWTSGNRGNAPLVSRR